MPWEHGVASVLPGEEKEPGGAAVHSRALLRLVELEKRPAGHALATELPSGPACSIASSQGISDRHVIRGALGARNAFV